MYDPVGLPLELSPADAVDAEALGADDVHDDDVDTVRRPRTRGDCVTLPRPCPFLSCRYHLLVDAGDTRRPLEERLAELVDAPEIGETCALDVASRGGATDSEVASALRLSRQRVQQIELRALTKLEVRVRRAAVSEERDQELDGAATSRPPTSIVDSK